MTKDEALKMCLEYIETDAHERKYVRHAIKEALAQQGRVTYAGNGTTGFSESERPTGYFLQIPPQTEEKLITIVDIEKIAKFKERNE